MCIRSGQWRKTILARGLILFVFWLLLAGSADLQTVAVGLIVAAATAWVSDLLLPAPPRQSFGTGSRVGQRINRGLLRAMPMAVLYFLRMLYELVIANVKVALIVLTPRLPISPRWFHYAPPVASGWARTLLANSVTITPGTLTVELSEHEFLVHCLTADAGPGLVGWSAERRVVALEHIVVGHEQG